MNFCSVVFYYYSESPLGVLVDLELPLLNPKLFFLDSFSFFRNKRLIEKFFEDSEKLNIKILTAEYVLPSKIIQKGLELVGVSYPIEKYSHKKLVMFYSSMIKDKSLLKKVKQRIIKYSAKLGKKSSSWFGSYCNGSL